MRLLSSLGFSMLLLAGQAYAQHKDTVLITPGDANFLPGRLSSYSSQYDFFTVEDGAETLVGGLEDNFSVTGSGNDRQALRVCRIKFGPNTILDSGLCRLQGLKPVYHRSVQPKRVLNFLFAGNTITGNVTTLGDTEGVVPINYTTSVALFDSYYEDIIAKSVSLQKGFLFRFPEYIYERGGIVWSLGEVIGNEEKQEGAGKRIEWTVKLYELNNKQEIIRTTVYSINEKDKDIISREYLTANGRIIMRKKP